MNKLAANSQNAILAGLTAILIANTFVPFLSTISFIILNSLIILIGLVSVDKIVTSKPFVYMLFFVAVEMLYASLGKGLPVNMVIYQALLYLTSIVICGNIKHFSHKNANFLFFLMMGLLLFTFVKTFLALQIDNMVIRHHAYGNNEGDFGGSMFGVYSYGVGEALAIILPAMTAFAIGLKKRILQVIIYILVVFGIITQFVGSLTTSAILSLLFCGIVVLLTLFDKRRVSSAFLSVVIIVIIIIVFLPATKIAENMALMIKMEDINQSYSSGQAVGQVADRNTLYLQSLKVVARNPILGLGVIPIDFGRYNSNTVSLHTTIFDFWGMYGLFAIFFVLSWVGVIKSSVSILSPDRRKQYKWAFVSLFFLLLLKGPVTIGINFQFSTVLLSLLYYKEVNSETNKLM